MASADKPRSKADPHLEALFAAIEEERREVRTPRPPLEGEVLETRRDEIIQLVAQAVKAVDAADRAEAAAFNDAIAHGLKEYDEVQAKRAQAVAGSKYYSPEARQASVDLFTIVADVRRTITTRSDNSEIGGAVKEAFGVGTNVYPDAPRDVRDLANAQLAALADPVTRAFLKKKGVSADYHARRLEPLAKRLVEEISRGANGGVTTSDVTAAEYAALWWLDISLERAVVFCREHGAEKEAAKLESRVPRRHVRRVGEGGGKVDPEEKKPGGDTDKTPTDPE